ncbi:MAG: aldehyde ferredoxin oxidoreductase C-terminal domain-containing protein [Bacillota bacterium]
MVIEGRAKNLPAFLRGDVWHKGAALIGTPRYTEFLKVKPLPCINYPLGCHRHIEYEFPSGEKPEGNGPEYETIGMMGSNLLIDDLPAICLANDMCNRAGIDTVSTGAFIGFLMKCYQAGWLSLKDTGGLELKWGDGKVLVELTKQINQSGRLGKLL